MGPRFEQACFLPKNFVRGISKDCAESPIGLHDASLGVGDNDAVQTVFEHTGGKGELLLGQVLRGNVLDRSDRAQRTPVGAVLASAACVRPPDPAIGKKKAMIEIVEAAFAHGRT